jgi:hypothetical protein
VVVSGTLDKSDDKDQGYVVEAMIPWKSFTKAKKTPPAIGDAWRLNLFTLQEGAVSAWSPFLAQGNALSGARLGTVRFVEKGWKPAAPPASASAGPAASGVPRAKPAASVSGKPAARAPAAPPPAAPPPAAPAPAKPTAAPATP